MSGLDVSRLSPADCSAALRSFPRRYRAVVAPIADDDNVDAIASRPGPDGLSSLQLMAHATRSIGRLHNALREVVVHDGAAVDADVIDGLETLAAPNATTSVEASVEAALDALQLECEGLATVIDGIHGDSWARTARVATTERTVSALDLARAAAKVGADALRATERAMAEARRAG